MIRFALLGLGVGGIYALISLGLVVVYRGSGVVNFAQGAFALVGAYVYYKLNNSFNLPVGLAVLGGIVVTGFVGLLTHLLVMRPLRNAPPLTKVIATLGIMVALQQLGNIILGSSVTLVPSFIPDRAVTPISGATVGEDRFILLAISLLATIILWVFYRYSRFGAVTTAVAENERAAQYSGHSPDVIAAANWVLGAMLAGAAGILIAPIINLNVNSMVLLIIPALAVCMVANFSSFAGAFVAAIVIGMLQSIIISESWIPAGWSDAVPFLVVILVVVIRGRGLPLRSHVNEVLPEIGTGILRPIPIAIGSAIMAVLLLTLSVNWVTALTVSVIGAILCISLVVVTGYAGQLSLAQFAFAGWAAWAAGRLSAVHGIPFIPSLIIGLAAAIPVGVLVGLPALRTRGITLAIVTFGLAFSFQSILFQSVPYTGGLGGTNLKPASVFGWDIDATKHPSRYAIACLIVLILVALAAANLRRGRSGRRLVAVRSNERAAASLGINVYGAKLYAFALSAGIAGLAGVLLAFQSTSVNYSQFDVFSSISIVIYTVIGGVGFLIGGLFAGFVFAGGVSVQIVSSIINSGSILLYINLVLALLLIPTLIQYPNGLAAWLTKALPSAYRRLRHMEGPVEIPPGEEPASVEAAAATNGAEPATAEPATAEPAKVVTPIEPVVPRTLAVKGITVRYGGVQALSEVSLEVKPGQVVGLMGPNGAGKTTLIDAVTGFAGIAHGTIEIDGQRIDKLSPRRRARAGVARTFQSLELFDQLTVRENLRAASDRRDTMAYLTDLVYPVQGELSSAALLAIETFELEDELDRLPTELPYGRRRQVALARSIATQPSVLLLDEPAAGLNATETHEFATSVRRLADDWGMGILLVEHDVPMLNQVCDHLVVIDFGIQIAEGTPDEIRTDPRVIAAYLGDAPDERESDAALSSEDVASGAN